MATLQAQRPSVNIFLSDLRDGVSVDSLFVFRYIYINFRYSYSRVKYISSESHRRDMMRTFKRRFNIKWFNIECVKTFS